MTVGSVSHVSSVWITIDALLRLSQQRMVRMNASKFVLTATMVTSIHQPKEKSRIIGIIFTSPTTSTVIASCSDFDLLHDFLARIGAAHFESVFTNEQDSFSRKPGRETHGLKRRKIQFTHWIDNIFVKINWHLEKRKFRRCFEETGKLFDGGMIISKDFNQCPFIEATTIDEYFENILNFVKWFYDGSCEYAGLNIVFTLHHRLKRINEIKMEVQAHVQSKKNQKVHNQVFQKSDE